jgi:putative ABC transport system permease protein
MKFFRSLKKSISLRIVNFVGLTIMFACLLLSSSYIKRELSYEKHHTKAGRIVRLSLQFDNQTIDGRLWGNAHDELLKQIPEIEKMVKMYQIYTATLTYQGKNHVINNFFSVNNEFNKVFDLPLLQGDSENALQRKSQAVISERFARDLFGGISHLDFEITKIHIDGNRIGKDTIYICGIFKDIPQTSHFNTDLLICYPDDYFQYGFFYTYLLLENKTDLKALEQKITERIKDEGIYTEIEPPRALLMPLTDIHLHSHNLREMSINGNINYIYLVVGANVLLLIVVLFNLWLNASLIFGRNRRHYQLLRLHGMPTAVVFKDEAFTALFVGFISILTGLLLVFQISRLGSLFFQISVFEIIALSIIFLVFIITVSLIPALKNISLTQFLNTNVDLKPVKFSYSNVKYMLIGQYAVVMFVVILAFGINKQMNLVKDKQVGGNEQNVLVLSDQPEPVKKKYNILRTELLKHQEIESVTACFQLPGVAILDNAFVKKGDEQEGQYLPIMVAGEDFIPFFRIPLITGQNFSPSKFDYQTEFDIAMDFYMYQKTTEHIEEYVINRKALASLGFETPEDAIGKLLHIVQGGIGYFNKGIIVGVTSDFNYTGLYEEIEPLLILQRNGFLHCIMVRLNPKEIKQARQVFENVWNEVNPDYPADYVFMNNIFKNKYVNEINAQYLVYIFSLLCFIIADLGLIIFMAFIIRRRTKEIGIRKVYGAGIGEVIKMLNLGFVQYVAMAFAIAIPVAWYVMNSWLQRFAYQTSLNWWIFALAGCSVLFISALSVSAQSLRAATANPVDAIKIE